MAAIKLVLGERTKIRNLIRKETEEKENKTSWKHFYINLIIYILVITAEENRPFLLYTQVFFL